MNSGAVIIDSNEEEIQRLTEKWKKVEKKAKKLINFGTSGAVITILSPFDFEGPVAEIVTTVIAAVGFIMKNVARNKLEELQNIESTGLSSKDTDELRNIVGNFANAINHPKAK